MYGNDFRSPKVNIHSFSMIPSAQIPRSKFRIQQQHKTTIVAGNLFPVFVTEVLPGDTFNGNMTAFVRMSTPVYPIMDNMDLEAWFFFVPNRIVWQHWVNFMGEQPQTPSDSISYTIPQIVSPTGGFAALSLYDYFGMPTGTQLAGHTISINALPFRAYNKIFNEWFRDQNLQNAAGYGATNTVYDIGDGPDPYTNYAIQQLNKRHDYFTSALPWTQKGGTPISLPLTGNATVRTSSTNLVTGNQFGMNMLLQTTGGVPANNNYLGFTTATSSTVEAASSAAGGALTANGGVYPANLYADLSTATATTINALRLAFQTQRLLERDARGGTRYTEIIRSHFGVTSPDMRLQRPEYLGGGKTPVNIAPVPQTSGTGASGTTAALGTLAAVGTSVGRGMGFRQSFTEHGYIIGLVAIRSDQIYQQGLRRMWTRSTRYDFYFPVFAMLGEQSIRNDEIYTTGTATDTQTFGYQERWAEYRYMPSMISGAFKSTYTTPLDAWHLAYNYASLPTLSGAWMFEPLSFILDRNLAAGATARTNQEQFLCDFFFDIRAARPMPVYSVPGLIDHF